MGKEALEHLKTAADTEPAKAKGETERESDKLGTLAKADSSPEHLEIEHSLDVVKQSYHWFGKAATERLRTLRDHLHKEDEPEWVASLASGLFEMAIGAGAAGAGAYLAKKVAGSKAGEGVTEFVKVMFEGGIGAGIAAGRAKLSAGKDEDVIDPFIDAQIEAIDQATQENQSEFIMKGQDKIKTVHEAKALREACDRPRVVESANKQYEASRDSWISYLAQSKFGAIGSRGGAVQPNVSDVGSTTTNMTDKARRKETNARAPGFVPSKGPDTADAGLGEAQGVLVVSASLPSIVAGLQLAGRPQVHRAHLNGVNEGIREQYENVPLGSLHIPRQLHLVLDGESSVFKLGVDERGSPAGIPRTGPLHDWLVARSTVAHPENASRSDFGKVLEGTRLLLDDIVATSIRK